MKSNSAVKASLNRKESTHTRILETAAKAIRRSGYSGTGVADIMKEAGLTHGGFYAHFASRDDMLAEAADHAGAETLAIFGQVFANAPKEQRLGTLMNAYLSDAHVADVEMGCAFAALGSEMHRQAPAVRAVSTRRIKEMIGLIEEQLSDREQPRAHEDALVMIATMVGTLILARAVDDPDLSVDLRQATLKHFSSQRAL